MKNKSPDFKAVMGKIQPVKALNPELKVVLYGKAGTGKTTLAATFPKPGLLIDIAEMGTDSVNDVKGLDVLRPTSWEDIEQVYWMLKKGSKYKTVIIDTVSQLQDLAIREVTKKESSVIGGWGEISRQQWGRVATMVKTKVLDLRDLPINLVFIAHDRQFGNTEEGEEDGAIAPSVGPRVMPSIASTLNAAVGIIGNTFIRETSREIKIGKKKIEKRKISYCLRVGPHASYVTKLRKPRGIEAPAFVEDPSYDKIREVMKGEDRE